MANGRAAWHFNIEYLRIGAETMGWMFGGAETRHKALADAASYVGYYTRDDMIVCKAVVEERCAECGSTGTVYNARGREIRCPECRGRFKGERVALVDLPIPILLGDFKRGYNHHHHNTPWA